MNNFEVMPQLNDAVHIFSDDLRIRLGVNGLKVFFSAMASESWVMHVDSITNSHNQPYLSSPNNTSETDDYVETREWMAGRNNNPVECVLICIPLVQFCVDGSLKRLDKQRLLDSVECIRLALCERQLCCTVVCQQTAREAIEKADKSAQLIATKLQKTFSLQLRQVNASAVIDWLQLERIAANQYRMVIGDQELKFITGHDKIEISFEMLRSRDPLTAAVLIIYLADTIACLFGGCVFDCVIINEKDLLFAEKRLRKCLQLKSIPLQIACSFYLLTYRSTLCAIQDLHYQLPIIIN